MKKTILVFVCFVFLFSALCLTSSAYQIYTADGYEDFSYNNPLPFRVEGSYGDGAFLFNDDQSRLPYTDGAISQVITGFLGSTIDTVYNLDNQPDVFSFYYHSYDVQMDYVDFIFEPIYVLQDYSDDVLDYFDTVKVGISVEDPDNYTGLFWTCDMSYSIIAYNSDGTANLYSDDIIFLDQGVFGYSLPLSYVFDTLYSRHSDLTDFAVTFRLHFYLEIDYDLYPFPQYSTYFVEGVHNDYVPFLDAVGFTSVYPSYVYREGHNIGYNEGYSDGFEDDVLANGLGSFLSTSVGAFLNAPIFGFISVGDIFVVCLGILLLVVFTRLFAGG